MSFITKYLLKIRVSEMFFYHQMKFTSIEKPLHIIINTSSLLKLLFVYKFNKIFNITIEKKSPIQLYKVISNKTLPIEWNITFQDSIQHSTTHPTHNASMSIKKKNNFNLGSTILFCTPSISFNLVQPICSNFNIFKFFVPTKWSITQKKKIQFKQSTPDTKDKIKIIMLNALQG